MDESGIASDKVVAFVHDNCKNMILKHGWRFLGCAEHTLQPSELEIPSISLVIGAGRRLSTHFWKSKPAPCALRIYQQDMRIELHQLIQDLSAQNSTHLTY